MRYCRQCKRVVEDNDDFCLHCGEKKESSVPGAVGKTKNHALIVAIAAGIVGITVSISGFFLAGTPMLLPYLPGDAIVGNAIVGIFLSAVGIAAPFAADKSLGVRMMYLAGIGIFFYSFLLGLIPAALFLIGGRLLSKQTQ